MEEDMYIEELKTMIAKEKISKCIIATTSGESAMKIGSILKDKIEIIAVRKQYGAKEKNVQEMSDSIQNELLDNNIKIVTNTHAFGGVERAIRKSYGTWQPSEIISGVLRIFGVGVKVAIEISMMCVDVGVVNSGEKILAIGGEKKGFSQAVILNAVNTDDFFNMKVIKVLNLKE